MDKLTIDQILTALLQQDREWLPGYRNGPEMGYQQAIKDVREALALREALIEWNGKMAKVAQITVRTHPDLREKLKQAAKEEGRTLSEYLVEAALEKIHKGEGRDNEGE